MTIHFLHTSDWHLGQFFHSHSRHYEHEQFLQWLLEQIKEKQPHALLIAGDIFDVINPSAQAQKQLYQFLADAHEHAPMMQTLMIAGNHDSGSRIEQVEPLLARYNAKAIGVIQKKSDGSLDLERLLIPIFDQEKNIVAWCLALPFLRSAEITGINEHTDDSQNAITYLHEQLINIAKQKVTAEQALILMSHAHMQGGETSDSERPIIIGNEEALSTHLFDPRIDYVALGHLHKPQKVGQTYIRYSGSPIPLSFSEVNYKHQILEVTINPAQKGDLRYNYQPLYIPRSVALYKIKGQLDEVFTQLRQLPHSGTLAIEQRAYVDILYRSDVPPPPDLRQLFEEAMPSDCYRLVSYKREYPSNHHSEITDTTLLEPPTPEQLFKQLWKKQGYSEDIQVTQDFLSLLHEAHTLQE